MPPVLSPVEPILIAELLPELHAELVTLLRGLATEQWASPTVAGKWTVRDVAAHLLDTDIRRLSFQRDQVLLPTASIRDYRDLVAFLDRLNADWIEAARRISPRLLVEFLELTGPEVCALFRSLNPHESAIFPVAWAGDHESPNWFDIAREYTEKWHHQQQIRDAVRAQGLTGRRWLFPVLDTFMRGLPHRYRETPAEEGTRISFHVSGEAGGDWTLIREPLSWRLYAGSDSRADSRVETDQDTAWRLLTKGLSSEAAALRTRASGRVELGQPFLGMLAVMA